MFGRKKQKNSKGGNPTMAGITDLIVALKKWQAAVQERDNLLKAAYAENKELKAKVETLTGEKETLTKEKETLTNEKNELQQQLSQAKSVATDPPPAPQPET